MNNEYSNLEDLTESNFRGINSYNDFGETEMHLTEREKEIIKLSATGLPVKIIADNLHLSKRTVEKHRSNIMAKTGTNNIIEAILFINKHNHSFQVTDN